MTNTHTGQLVVTSHRCGDVDQLEWRTGGKEMQDNSWKYFRLDESILQSTEYKSVKEYSGKGAFALMNH